MLLPWVLVSAALLTAIIIMAVVCMCNYAKGGMKKSMPQLLVRQLFLQCPLVCRQGNVALLENQALWHITVYMLNVFM